MFLREVRHEERRNNDGTSDNSAVTFVIVQNPFDESGSNSTLRDNCGDLPSVSPTPSAYHIISEAQFWYS